MTPSTLYTLRSSDGLCWPPLLVGGQHCAPITLRKEMDNVIMVCLHVILHVLPTFLSIINLFSYNDVYIKGL